MIRLRPNSDATAGSATNNRIGILYTIGQAAIGGSERQLLLFLKYLDKTRWNPSVLVYNWRPFDPVVSQLRDEGIEVFLMPRRAFRWLGKLWFTIRTALKVRPDVIHSWTAHDNPYAALAGWFAAVRLRWGSLRGSTTSQGFSSLPSWYRWMTLRMVSKIVVNSQALVLELRQIGLSESTIVLLPNCVEVRSFGNDIQRGAVAQPSGFSQNHRVFGNVGNIRKVKNQVLFVRALAILIQKHPNARGLIIGAEVPGEEWTKSELENEIERFGLKEKCMLAGLCEDARWRLNQFTALCMSSNSEGMPNVVLEAMAAKVPVVATAVGGVPEVVVDGQTGVLVSPDDAESMAMGMDRVLEFPEETERMCQLAYERVTRERDCAAIARQLEISYTECLGIKW